MFGSVGPGRGGRPSSPVLSPINAIAVAPDLAGEPSEACTLSATAPSRTNSVSAIMATVLMVVMRLIWRLPHSGKVGFTDA